MTTAKVKAPAPSYDEASEDEKTETARSLATFKMILALLASRPNGEHPAIISALVGVHCLMFGNPKGNTSDAEAMAFYDDFIRGAVENSLSIVRAMEIIGPKDSQCDCENCTRKREMDGTADAEKTASSAPTAVPTSASSREAEFRQILARMREGRPN